MAKTAKTAKKNDSGITQGKIPIVDPQNEAVKERALAGAGNILYAVAASCKRGIGLDEEAMSLMDCAHKTIAYYSKAAATRNEPNLTAALLFCMRY